MKRSGYRYCPRCAERLAPGAEACPMCGADVPAERVLSAGARWARVLPVLFALALLFALWPLPALTRTPEEKFIDYNLSLLPELSPAGSFTLTAVSDDPALQTYLRGSAVTLKYSAGLEGFALDAGVTLMASPILSAALTLEGTRLGAYVPQIKDVYYTVDLPVFLDRMGLVPDDEPVADPPSPAAYMAVAGRYWSLLTSLVSPEDLDLSEDVPVTLSTGEELTCDVYTFTPSPRALRRVLREAADTVETDRDLLAILAYASRSDTPTHDARQTRKQLSDALYAQADAWSRALDEPLTWTLAVRRGEVAAVTIARGDFALTLEPRDGALDILLRHPDLAFLEGMVFRLRYTPGDGPAAPEPAGEEDITRYSLPRLLSLARELEDNVGADIIYAFGDILEVLGL